MARIQAALTVAAPADRVWDLLTDWPAHSRWIALTAVTIDADSPTRSGLGTRFTGRTHVGPVGFDDPMTVTDWQPPADGRTGYCRVLKRGPWLTGWAEIRVQPNGTSTDVVWVEVVDVRWLPPFLGGVAGAVGSLLFGRTLRSMAADLRDPGPKAQPTEEHRS